MTFEELVAAQQPLGAEFERVLQENFWGLLVEDTCETT